MYRRRGFKSYGNFRAMGPYRRANYLARKRIGSRFARRSVYRTGGNYNQVIPRTFGGKVALSQGPEKKFLDSALTAPAFGDGAVTIGAGTFILCDGMVQGTSGITRIGRQITVKSVAYNMYLKPAATTTSGILRFMLIWDHQANGAAPTLADILETGGTAASAITSPLNMSNRERFKVLVDKRIPIGQTVATQAFGPVPVHAEKFRKCNQIVTYNGGNAGTVADIATDSLYAVLFTTAGTANVSLVGNVRIRFTDA